MSSTVNTVSPPTPPRPPDQSPPLSVTITPQAGVVDDAVQPPHFDSVVDDDDTESILSSRSDLSSLSFDLDDIDEEDVLFDISSFGTYFLV